MPGALKKFLWERWVRPTMVACVARSILRKSRKKCWLGGLISATFAIIAVDFAPLDTHLAMGHSVHAALAWRDIGY